MTVELERPTAALLDPQPQHKPSVTTKPPKTMTAAVIAAPGELRLEEHPLPEPGPRAVLVALEGCGVCASNLPVWKGREWFEYPLPAGNPGHEGWGRVIKTGPGVHSVAVGDRVAFLSDNAYATHDIAAVNSLIKLPDALGRQLFPGEPLGCAMNVFSRSQIAPGDWVAIIGIGFLGAILAQLASQAGARVIAISRRDFALSIAEQYGAVHAIPMDDHWQIVKQVKAITDGKGCECVIEAAGKQWPLDLAGELTAPRGRLVVAGYHQDGPRQVNMQQWNWQGIDVINAHERDPAIYLSGMKCAVNAVLNGKLDPTPLYTHQLPLAQLDEAFALLQERPDGFMKALITF